MLSAKLFAFLAVLEVGLAAFDKTSGPSLDYIHQTYLVVTTFQLESLFAISSLCFALAYAASVWLLRPLNRFLSLTHLSLAMIGFGFFCLFLYAQWLLPDDLEIHYWPERALVIGALCFLLGCATFAVNCIWTAVALPRPRSG